MTARSAGEIRALNAEYLGAYLYRKNMSEGDRFFSRDFSQKRSHVLFREAVELLARDGLITPEERDALDALNGSELQFTSPDEAKQKVRNILKTSPADVAWLGNV